MLTNLLRAAMYFGITRVMLYSHNNYRSYLKAVLADRIAKNPQYSMRAFAISLGISHAALSQVFSGKKNFSGERVMTIAEKLGLHEVEYEYFCLLAQYESVKKPEFKIALQEKLNRIRPQQYKVNDLSLDVFKTIADWYHIPILHLTRLKGFKFTAQNVAKKLGINSNEAAAAIERLERLELLEKISEGKYTRTDNRLLAQSKISNVALRQFHRQFLEKAIGALETQTPEEKINGSETFAINPKVLDEARTITEDYFTKMATLSDRREDPTDVYHLQVNFLRITEKEETI